MKIGYMTGDNSLYKYISRDVPQQKINYSYAKFGGEDFLDEYKKSREIALLNLDNNELTNRNTKDLTATGIHFYKWIKLMEKDKDINEKELLLLLKRFEVTKKIYETYDINFRPIDKEKYMNFHLYVLFGEVLVLAYNKHKKIQYLNTLLKANDICISLIELLSEQLRKKVALNVKFELEFTYKFNKS